MSPPWFQVGKSLLGFCYCCLLLFWIFVSMSKSQKREGCFVCLDRHMNSNSNREAQRTWSGENENSGCPRRTIVTERSHTFSLKLDEELGMFTFRADARCSPIEFVDDFERFTASPNDFAFKYEGETFDAQRPDSFSPTDSVGEKQTTARRQIFAYRICRRKSRWKLRANKYRPF